LLCQAAQEIHQQKGLEIISTSSAIMSANENNRLPCRPSTLYRLCTNHFAKWCFYALLFIVLSGQTLLSWKTASNNFRIQFLDQVAAVEWAGGLIEYHHGPWPTSSEDTFDFVLDFSINVNLFNVSCTRAGACEGKRVFSQAAGARTWTRTGLIRARTAVAHSAVAVATTTASDTAVAVAFSLSLSSAIKITPTEINFDVTITPTLWRRQWPGTVCATFIIIAMRSCSYSHKMEMEHSTAHTFQLKHFQRQRDIFVSMCIKIFDV
jgi:hypothetical protein